jgi:hypothetical protein
MFETSKDILNIVLAVSIASFTFFVCWSLFYLSMTLQQIFHAARSMRKRLDAIDEVIKALKDKIDNSASYLLLLGEGVKKLVEVLRARSEKEDDK